MDHLIYHCNSFYETTFSNPVNMDTVVKMCVYLLSSVQKDPQSMGISVVSTVLKVCAQVSDL